RRPNATADRADGTSAGAHRSDSQARRLAGSVDHHRRRARRPAPRRVHRRHRRVQGRYVDRNHRRHWPDPHAVRKSDLARHAHVATPDRPSRLTLFMADFYGTLEVARNASEDEIKTAYRKLAMRYHPDRNNGSADAEEKFKQITEAYDVLRDP